MPGTKCPTVRSTGTTSVRSALMPIVMKSRASIVLARHSGAREARTRNPEIVDRDSGFSPGGLPRNDANASLLRGRRALHEGLAALHLVSKRGFVDLDDDGIGVDAEVLHEGLGDVAHHAGLLFIGAAHGHADGDLRHLSAPCFRPGRACPGHPRSLPSNKTRMPGTSPGMSA